VQFPVDANREAKPSLNSNFQHPLASHLTHRALAVAVVLPALFLTGRASTIAEVIAAEFLADWADAVAVVLTASLLTHGADAIVTVISAELVLIGHGRILVSPLLTRRDGRYRPRPAQIAALL